MELALCQLTHTQHFGNRLKRELKSFKRLVALVWRGVIYVGSRNQTQTNTMNITNNTEAQDDLYEEQNDIFLANLEYLYDNIEEEIG